MGVATGVRCRPLAQLGGRTALRGPASRRSISQKRVSRVVILGKHSAFKVINLFSKIRGNLISSSPHGVLRNLRKMFSFPESCLPSGAAGDGGTARAEGRATPQTPAPPQDARLCLWGLAFGWLSQPRRGVRTRPRQGAPSPLCHRPRQSSTHPPGCRGPSSDLAELIRSRGLGLPSPHDGEVSSEKNGPGSGLVCGDRVCARVALEPSMAERQQAPLDFT